MPGIMRNRSSLEEEEDDDEEESTSSESSGPVTAPPRSAKKRPRLSNGNDEVDDSWMLSPPATVRRGQQQQSRAPSNHGPRADSTISSTGGAPTDPNEFKPGQLLKVHVRNFVTYTDATFLPGPSLNMVIGPNGTGKSTLVCAICIGLGFSTAHLGRAKELSEFVKHGTKDASIEIQLKGFPGRTDKTIRLDFQRDGDKKQWSLDGQQCRAKDIHRQIAQFGIQVDNLCHFLPQDRVVEFSRLNAKDRLSSTLRAAAPAEIVEYHEQLKNLAVNRRKVHTEQDERQQQLKQLERRQESQRGDVERMRKRTEIINKRNKLQKLFPIARHNEARAAFLEAKGKRAALDQDLTRLNNLVQPFDEAVKSKKAYHDKVTKVVDGRRKLCDMVETQANKLRQEQEANETKVKALDQRKDNEKKALNVRKKQTSDLQGHISRVEAQMEQAPIEFDAADFNRRINDKTREARTLQQQVLDIRESASDRDRQMREKQRQVQQTKEELSNLHSQSGQMRNKLAQLSQDTVKAWDWIKNNQHRFKKAVHGPPLLTCSVKDARYATMIESLFGPKDVLRITCTDVEDWKFLQKYLSEELHLYDFALFNSKTKLEEFQRPLNEDQMRGLGLEGWAIDFLEGPDDVLSMLCDYARIHTTGIVWQDVNNQQFNALQDSGLSNWVTSRNTYRVTRRKEYGDAAKSTRVVAIADRAKYWASQGVDVNAEANLKRQIAELEDEISQMEDVRNNTRKHIDDIQTSIKKLEDEKADLSSEKEEKQRHNSMLAALPNKLASLQNKLEESQVAQASFQAAFEEIRQERETIIVKNGQLAINYANLVDSLRQKHAELLSASIAMIEAESDHEQCRKQYADATKERDEKTTQRQKVNAEVKAEHKKAMFFVQQWNNVLEDDPTLQGYYDTLTDEEKTRTPSQLETEIEAAQANVDLLAGGNPQMIKDFEARAERIDKLADDVRASSDRAKQLQEQITAIRQGFEPAVDALVDKISGVFGDLFARIGCAGSVQMFKAGVGSATDNEQGQTNNGEGSSTGPLALEEGHEYENWAIHILVKFRENEALSVLDSHRQSGGERAVTTIYYLMALQRLSRAPFRVVDEINQGMDPRNERIVHERMVDMSCGLDEHDDGDASRSQYFLITPKLLPNLKYARGMKVHCIASGEFMPPAAPKRSAVDAPTLDFRRLVEKEKARQAGLGMSSARRRSASVVDGVGA